MSFWDKFESKQEGIEDTVEFTIRTAIVTLSTVILVVVLALVVGLFMPNEIVDSTAVLEMINPAFQTILGEPYLLRVVRKKSTSVLTEPTVHASLLSTKPNFDSPLYYLPRPIRNS